MQINMFDVTSTASACKYGGSAWASTPAARNAERASGWSVSDSMTARIVRFFRNDSFRVPK